MFFSFSGTYRKTALTFLIVTSGLLLAACLPYSCENYDGNIDEANIYFDEEPEYYDIKYAKEPEPPENISDLLAQFETCVGGQYVIGGQGDRITDQFIESRQKENPDAFTEEQIEYLCQIAWSGKASGWRFPDYYAWDCSGLWWWGCNELKLYAQHMDCTAYITYHSYCTPISKRDLLPGDLVFYQNEENRIVHMGIVGMKGYVFESVGVFGGVVKKRTLEARVYDDITNGGQITEPDWNVFGRPKIFE